MKAKKFLAGLLSAAMVMSMGITGVMAEDKFDVNTFDADPEAMYIYHGKQYLDPTGLQGKTKIIVNGEDIASKCTFDRYETKNVATGGSTSYYRSYCTKVTPPEGTEFAINTPITISIENHTNINDYTNTFMIAELLNDDFSGDLNWKTNDTSKATVAIDNGRLKVTTNQNQYGRPVYHKDYDSQKAWSNYTISFDYEPGTIPEKSEGVLDELTLNYIYNSGTVTGTIAAKTSYAYQFRGHLRIYAPGINNGEGWAHRNYSTTYPGPSQGTQTHIKLSNTNGYMGAFISEGRYADEKVTGAIGAPTFSSALGYSSLGESSFYLDNVRVTKLIDPADMGELKVLDTFEADNDGMVVYTDKAVNTADLQAAITLKEDGTEVTGLTVSSVTTGTGYKSSGVESYANAYKITKTGGFTSGKIYDITIANLVTNDYSAMLKSAWSKVFKIRDIYSNDFSDATRVDYELKQTSSSTYHGNNTAEIVEGALKVTTGDTYPENHVLTFDYDNTKGESDYTVEFDLTPAADAPCGNWVRFGYTDNYTKAGNVAGFHVQSGGIRTYVKDNADGSLDYDYVKNAELVAQGVKRTYKMVKNGQRYTLYLDGTKYADYITTHAVSAGALVMRFFPQTTSFTIDNIRMTKAEEVVESVTAYGAKLEGELGTATAISFKVNNTYSVEKPCQAVVVAYGEHDVMLDAAICETTTLKVGENTLSADIDTTGALKVKVIILNSFENMNPYCSPIVIPE